MSYQALYRKWRPKTFDEVKGQDAIVTTLKNQIISGRIGHAYLFCGTRGTGKTSVAKILARAVNCPNVADGNPCNECETCKNILSESSMNVIEIDAASNNGVDNIRDIKEQVQYPPTEGRYKVFIIDEVHMLSIGAFNALLKTLEEPPEYVIFILATTEVHKIPVTILSRCQRYDFKRIPVDTIVERLKELTSAEGIELEDRAYAYIAKSADGAMRDALSLLDECVAFHPEGKLTYDQVLEVLGTADTTTFARLFNAVAAAKSVDALEVIEEAVNEGKELSQFATDFLWFMRNLLVLKTADDASRIIDASSENLEIMKTCAKSVNRDALMRYIRTIAELINKMRYSSQKRVLLEIAIIQLILPGVAQEPVNMQFPEVSPQGGQMGQMQAFPQGMQSGAPVKRTVKLSKAKYDDLMKLRDDWDKIIGRLSGATKPILRDTALEPGEGNLMFIVFANPDKYELGSRETTLLEITKLVTEEYGREFEFRGKLKKGSEPETEYVTEAEVEKLIKMEIDIEEG